MGLGPLSDREQTEHKPRDNGGTSDIAKHAPAEGRNGAII
jgi:hypothetical protein